jgi:5-methylcytosine-specific restriction endonuclease McrA
MIRRRVKISRTTGRALLALNELTSPAIKRRKPLKRTRIKVKPKRDPIPPGLRAEIIDRDGGACRYCHQYVGQDGHVHRIIFGSHGGKYTRENTILLCDFCHLVRIHHGGNRREWLWIVGTADHAEFVTVNPKNPLT